MSRFRAEGIYPKAFYLIQSELAPVPQAKEVAPVVTKTKATDDYEEYDVTVKRADKTTRWGFNVEYDGLGKQVTVTAMSEQGPAWLAVPHIEAGDIVVMINGYDIITRFLDADDLPAYLRQHDEIRLSMKRKIKTVEVKLDGNVHLEEDEVFDVVVSRTGDVEEIVAQRMTATEVPRAWRYCITKELIRHPFTFPSKEHFFSLSCSHRLFFFLNRITAGCARCGR